MRCTLAATAMIVISITMISCGKKVMVPPRIDLSEYQVLGIIEFTTEKGGELAPLATRKFMEAARKDQGVIRIIELGTEEEVLAKINHTKLDQAAYQEIGDVFNVNTVIVGQLTVSDVIPDISIAPVFGNMRFTAKVNASLAAQMIETGSGATIWNRSGSATEQVGDVSIWGMREFAFDAEDPERAYGKLIDALVNKVARDFQVTWERQ
jgi:hypothetical protein